MVEESEAKDEDAGEADAKPDESDENTDIDEIVDGLSTSAENSDDGDRGSDHDPSFTPDDKKLKTTTLVCVHPRSK